MTRHFSESQYLIELEASDDQIYGFTSGRGFAPVDPAPNLHRAFYAGVVSEGVSLSVRRETDGAGSNSGAAGQSFGNLILDNASGAFDFLGDLGFDGRALQILFAPDGAQSMAECEVIYRGTVTELQVQRHRVTIQARDRLEELNTPLGSVVDAAEWPHADGERMPVVAGSAVSVPLFWLDRVLLIAAVHDGAATVDGVYDLGVALTEGPVYSDLATLTSIAPAPGQYRVFSDPSGTYIRLGSRPQDHGKIAADVQTADPNGPAQIQALASRAATDKPITNLFNSTDFTMGWSEHNVSSERGRRGIDGAQSVDITASAASASLGHDAIRLEADTQYTIQCDLEHVSGTPLFSIRQEGSADAFAQIDLSDGGVTSGLGTASEYKNVSASASEVSNGVWRLNFSFTAPQTGGDLNIRFWIGSYTDDPFTGSVVRVSRPQLARGRPTDFFVVTKTGPATASPREHTNLLIHSNDLSHADWRGDESVVITLDQIKGRMMSRADAPAGVNQGRAQVLENIPLAGEVFNLSCLIYSETATSITLRARGTGQVQDAQNYTFPIPAKQLVRCEHPVAFAHDVDGATLLAFIYFHEFGVPGPEKTIFVSEMQLTRGFDRAPTITTGASPVTLNEDVNEVSFDDLSRPWSVGGWWPGETTILEAISEIAKSIGVVVFFNRVGKLSAARLTPDPAPGAAVVYGPQDRSPGGQALKAIELDRLRLGKPVKDVSIGYAKAHAHYSDLGALWDTDPSRAERISRTHARLVREDAAIAEKHRLADSIRIDTLLNNATDAERAADELRGALGAWFYTAIVKADIEALRSLELGQRIDIHESRFSPTLISAGIRELVHDLGAGTISIGARQ